MNRIAYGIEWETDGYLIDLPNEVFIPSEIDDDCIADYLSDEYEFLVNSYSLRNYVNIGDKVKWHDIGIDEFGEDKEMQENRIYEVIHIISDEMVLIADDYSEVEVFISELELVK